MDQVAGEVGLSRSTLLYYDRLGLLRPSGRSHGNYRVYSRGEVERLEQICLYRGMGVPLKEIGRILADSGNGHAPAILKKRLRSLEREIDDLRRQQRCIVHILQQSEMKEETTMLNKERWVAVMKAAGMSEDAMKNWHVHFEKMEPDAHQEFLESLGIDTAEINQIRQWSREGNFPKH